MTGAESNDLDALRSAFDFASFDDETLRDLARRSEKRSIAAGTLLFSKGSPAGEVYVVVDGRVSIFDEIHGAEREIAEVELGDFFAEVSAALHTARSRSARAKTDCELLVVPGDVIQELLENHPGLAARMMEAYTERVEHRQSAAE